MSLEPGYRVGPYEIERRLGSGGMGEVYQARDTRLHRSVAVKVLHQAAGPAAVRRLMAEARAAAKLNHPHIAAIHDVIEHEGSAFLVMEYVDGVSLRARLEREKLTVEEVVSIGAQLSEALAYAHRSGVIHRDIKPENIVLTRDGQVKLLDLGIARSVDEDADTMTGGDTDVASKVRGTLGYMAPEQLAGHRATTQSDIYGLGVVLFELLTDIRPFRGADAFTLAAAIAAGPAPRPSAMRPDVPADLDNVVARALERDPARRYRTAEAIHGDIARLQKRHDNQPPVTPLRFPWRWAAVLLLLVTIGVFAATRWYESGVAGSIALLPALNASDDPQVTALGSLVVTTLHENLSSIPGTTVVSSRPAAYRRIDRNPRAAAADLGAEYVVDVRVSKDRDRFGATVVLANRAAGTPLWTRSSTGGPREVMEAVVGGVTAALASAGFAGRRLTQGERTALARLPSSNADALMLYLAGRALLDAGPARSNAEPAMKALTDAVALDDSFALAHAARSQAATNMFNATRVPAWLDTAREATRRALALDPGRALVQEAAARVDVAANDLEAAERHAREAVRMAADADSGYRLLASILDRRQQRQDAIGAARTAVELRPELASNHYALGYYFAQAGQYHEAIGPLRRATEIEPGIANNFTTLGSAYHRMGDVQQAIGNYAQALRLAPNAQAYSNLGTAYYYAGQFDKAISNYLEALALDPSSATTHRNVADAYERLGRAAAARAAYAECVRRADARLKSNAQDVRLLAQKALCQMKLGRADAAEVDIAAALTLAKRADPDVLFKAAVIQALTNQTPAAFDSLAAALTLGYPAAFARDDWDLRSLRRHPRFNELVGNRK